MTREQIKAIYDLELEVVIDLVERPFLLIEEKQYEFPNGVPAGTSYGPGVRSFVLYLNQYHFIPSRRRCELVEDLFGQPLSEGTLQSALELRVGAAGCAWPAARDGRTTRTLEARASGDAANRHLAHVRRSSLSRQPPI